MFEGTTVAMCQTMVAMNAYRVSGYLTPRPIWGTKGPKCHSAEPQTLSAHDYDKLYFFACLGFPDIQASKPLKSYVKSASLLIIKFSSIWWELCKVRESRQIISGMVQMRHLRVCIHSIISDFSARLREKALQTSRMPWIIITQRCISEFTFTAIARLLCATKAVSRYSKPNRKWNLAWTIWSFSILIGACCLWP